MGSSPVPAHLNALRQRQEYTIDEVLKAFKALIATKHFNVNFIIDVVQPVSDWGYCERENFRQLNLLVAQFSIGHLVPIRHTELEKFLLVTLYNLLKIQDEEEKKLRRICIVLSKLQREKSPMSKESTAEGENHVAELGST